MAIGITVFECVTEVAAVEFAVAGTWARSSCFCARAGVIKTIAIPNSNEKTRKALPTLLSAFSVFMIDSLIKMARNSSFNEDQLLELAEP